MDFKFGKYGDSCSSWDRNKKFWNLQTVGLRRKMKEKFSEIDFKF